MKLTRNKRRFYQQGTGCHPYCVYLLNLFVTPPAMNFTVGVAGLGAVTIGFKGFGSFILLFYSPCSDKRGISYDCSSNWIRISLIPT
jgi:hypothetical protein